jgi:Protein of unknown function (DUF3575)
MKKTLVAIMLFPVFLSAQKTAVKLNLIGIPLGNYQVQVERLIIPHVAIAISASIMPKQNIPFNTRLKDEVDNRLDDPDIDISQVHDFLDNAALSNKNITPEIRFYVRRKLKGFYLSAYARTGTTLTEGPSFLQNNGQSVGTVYGESKNKGYGLMLGNHFTIGKRVSLDWWILGLHLNKLTADFKLNGTLSTQQQADLTDRLESIKTELMEELGDDATMTYTVNGSGYTVRSESPAPGIRGGITLGLRF